MIKKIIVSICIISMLALNVAFAKTFSDVEGTKYEDAIDTLTEFNIVDGYTDNTFKPDKEVTRAEMAKLIIMMLNNEETATALAGNTKFSDVASTSWASGYVNATSQLEIIIGYKDGTYKPNNSISYAEAATMLLRTLNYTKELEGKSYPLDYMNKAKEAGILENVVANSAQDKATRGYIAIMIKNTLLANTRIITSTTSKNGAIYGDGDLLIVKCFDDIKSSKEATVSSIDFEESVITLKEEESNRKFKCKYTDDEEILNLLGRVVSFIYNDKTEEFLQFKIVDEKRVEEIEIDEIDSDDTIIATDGEEYDLPKDEYIVMQYITNYEEAETAYITFNSKNKVEYVLLTGTPKVYVGLVTETGLKVDGNKGIEVKDPEGDFEEYAIDTSNKMKVNDVLLYSLDNDDFLIVVSKLTSDDGSKVEELASESIKLVKEDEVKLKKGTEYYVYKVDDGELYESKLSDINPEYDLVAIEEYSEVYYIFNFKNAVDIDDIVSKLSVNEAKELLEDAIDDAKPYVKKESSYSISSFEDFIEAYEEAVDAYDSGNGSAARLEIAANKLIEATSALNKKVSSTDKELRNLSSELEDLIELAETKKSSDYTTASFRVLTSELNKAKSVNLKNITTAKLQERVDDLEDAIYSLVTNEAEKASTDVKTRLNNLIKQANSISSTGYTTASYNKMKTALSSANTALSKNLSTAILTQQADNLEAAIKALAKS